MGLFLAAGFRRAFQIVALAACSILLLESISRMFHGFHAPLLPYRFEQGAARLPSGLDMRVGFPGHPSNRYVTDAWGARIADPGLAPTRQRDGVLVVGDSQMLGYMLNFEDTFGSRVAAELTGRRDAARLLAAPANHVETMLPSLQLYDEGGVEPQRVLIAGVNLGNDLDEMYSEAMYWTRDNSGKWNDWLLPRSYLWMDWILIRTQWLSPGNDPVGINRILYMLDSPERVVLARETVRELGRFLDDPLVSARDRLVVIVPSDVQVDPAQFQKYRRYYRSQEEFDRWDRQVEALAAMMNALEEYLAIQLERDHRTVIRFSQLIPRNQHVTDLFDDTSHHLTAESHRMIARAIMAKLYVH